MMKSKKTLTAENVKLQAEVQELRVTLSSPGMLGYRYTILGAARELGFTKNAVKYQVSKLPPHVVEKAEDGKIYITEDGLEILRERMGNKVHRSSRICQKCSAETMNPEAKFCWKCGTEIKTAEQRLIDDLQSLCGHAQHLPAAAKDKFIRTINSAVGYIKNNGSEEDTA